MYHQENEPLFENEEGEPYELHQLLLYEQDVGALQTLECNLQEKQIGVEDRREHECTQRSARLNYHLVLVNFELESLEEKGKRIK
jgi:hypothetical protein